ncbi:MAG: DEAD/DEAH box helicase [Candidatus Marinimicrobia bacterium]|jgi:DEAD/DEAH box helicase domain-containing protein|nr:DEAD/DEAH box helicase [Candidatus Neomarinimicrobiota bacterium]
MSAQTTSELLIEIFDLSGLPVDEVDSTVQRLVKLHNLDDGDNNKNKIYAKMLGQIPKVFPKQTSTYNSSIANYYDHLINDGQYNVVKFKQDPLSPPSHPTLTPPLHADIVAKLTQQGRQQLYSHQVRSIDLIRQGKNVLITTPTASGKSYGYVLPFLDAVKADPQTRGLFIFPMNALTNDQFDKLVEFGIGTVAKYDGTVKSHEKKKIRNNLPNALLTNPDQIHQSILRTHANWTNFFKNLKFIVIDEIHNYKGFFGSNVSNILFRLLEAVKKAGGNPQIICTSATINNAKIFAKELAWVDFEEVNWSGSGSPEKYYVMLDSISPKGLKVGDSQEEWIAGILEQLQKRSPQSLLFDLLLSLGDNGFQSMIFVNSRLQADQFRDIVQTLSVKYSTLKPEMVCSYHAGLSNTERQEIEHAIKNGNKKLIFTTSALELGIDIGTLDVCVLFGLPKTSNEIWQRIGRVGRDPSKSALAIIVNSYSADDIYYFFNPDRFFDTQNQPEEPIIYPYNEALRKLHLQCGYYEGLQKQDIVDKHLWNTVDATIKSESAYPRIPIRNSWNDPIILLDDGGAEIGTLEYERAYRELHPGAIHRTATSNYKVKKLVLKERTAHLKEIEDVEYYTNPDVETVIDIGANPVEEILSYGKYPLLIGRGELEVNLSVGGYWRIYQNGGFPRRSKLKNNSERKFKTKGFWLTIPPKKAMLWNSIIPEFSEKHSFNIFHSIEHLLIREIAEMGYCDASDVISLTYADHYNYRNPIIFIYDNYHKGLGISDRISINIDDLIRRAYSRLVNCKCYDGCPVCIIKNSFCEHREDFTDKARAVLFLNSMTGKQPKRKKYISRNDSLKQFTTYGGDYFKVGDEYAHGWKVIEKSDDEYILENGAGDIAYVPYEDSPL